MGRWQAPAALVFPEPRVGFLQQPRTYEDALEWALGEGICEFLSLTGSAVSVHIRGKFGGRFAAVGFQ